MIVLSAYVLVFYFYFPYRALSSFRTQAGLPEVEIFDLAKPDLPEEIKRFFVTVQGHVEELGFAFLTCASLRITPSNKTFVAFFFNGKTGDRTSAIAQLTTFQDKTWLRVTYLQFLTPYENEFAVGTSNSPDPQRFKMPLRKNEKFQDVQLAKHLYLIHRHLTKPYSELPVRPVKKKEELIESIATEHLKFWERRVRVGLAVYTKDRQYFKYTFKGILLNLWNNKFPFPQIYRFQQNIKAKWILRKMRSYDGPLEVHELPKIDFVYAPIKASFTLAERAMATFFFFGVCGLMWWVFSQNYLGLAILTGCLFGYRVTGMLGKFGGKSNR